MARIGFLMFLVGTYYFLQGMGGNPGTHAQALKKFLKEGLGYTPTEMAAFLMLITVPWMIKPLYGVISDFLPIFRMRRKSYFILAGFLSGGMFLAFALLNAPVSFVWMFLFAAAIGFAFSDVLCDAVMIEKGQPLNATDRLQAVQWAAISTAGIIVAFSKGYIAEYLTFQRALMISAAFPVIMVFFTLFFLKENKVESSGTAARQAWNGLKLAVKSKPLWAAAIFLFVFRCTPNMGSVFYYYEKDTLKFSDVLIGQIDTVGSVSFLIGTALYALIAKKISHDTLLKGVVITGAVTTLAYLLFTDALSGFIVTIVTSAVYVWAFLGTLTIAARVCPKNAEGTVFALLMSFLNIGDSVGGIIGGKMYERWGYNWLVIVSTVLISATWFLIPLVKIKGK